MITREEALNSEPLVIPNGYYNKVYKKSEYTAIINMIFDQQDKLQQHIKDLESQLSSNPLQLTCDGCVMQNDFFKGGCATHAMCIRKSTDNYQPKDTK